MKKVLSQLEIKDAIIHRYENLLVDTVTTNDSLPLTGSLAVTIMDNDPLGRDIFFKTVGKESYLLPTVHMEILALGSIAGTGIVSDGHVVLFTGISNFKHYHPFPINNTLTGTFEKLPDKGPFLRYKGATFLGDTCLASGEMMAIYTKKDQQSASPAKRITFPSLDLDQSITAQEDYKPKSITMSDTLHYLTDTECITSYTYPQTHPFTKGHFPGNPLMMGVMQWASVEDACRTFYIEKNLSGTVTLSFSATITRADGSITAEIRSCQVLCIQHHDCLDCSVIETKKITFRSMVKPNEKIFIYLTNITPS